MYKGPVKEPEALAELLNEFYDIVFRPIPTLPTLSVTMDIPVLTPCVAHKQFSTLDISKNPDPEQLRPKRLK